MDGTTTVVDDTSLQSEPRSATTPDAVGDDGRARSARARLDMWRLLLPVDGLDETMLADAPPTDAPPTRSRRVRTPGTARPPKRAKPTDD